MEIFADSQNQLLYSFVPMHAQGNLGYNNVEFKKWFLAYLCIIYLLFEECRNVWTKDNTLSIKLWHLFVC